jgi:mono/diheme cytochrome c family protein
MSMLPCVSRIRSAAAVGATLSVISLLLPAAGSARQTQAQQGQEIFQTTCFACHTVGGGRLVGPDLQGVTERRDEEWIIGFVQRSQATIASGDPTAVALAEDFPGLVMPDNALTDDQVRAVLAYIDAGPSSTPAAPVESAPATDAQVTLGQGLFQGTTRLANGGPACNSCHDVTNDAVIGGGVLAPELTSVFSRLGGATVRAILGSSPFPVMQRAYRDKALTDDEVVALVGFLEQADAEQAFHQPRDYGPKLFGAGVVGAAILLVLYSLLWGGRRKGSVNQAIYDRQVKSI